MREIPSRHFRAAKRKCRGRAVSLMWAAGSQAVDQSSARNKRDDRLAEGHERVAGAVMVLRTVSDMRPFLGKVTACISVVLIIPGATLRHQHMPSCMPETRNCVTTTPRAD